MSSLVSSRSTSQYTDEQRREAIANYVVLGNVKRVSEIVDIPRDTLYGWVKSDWGLELITTIQNEKTEQLDANLTRMLEKAGETIEDRLMYGDSVVDRDGQLMRKPVSMRDTGTVFGIMFDKQRLLRNQATSISTNSSALDNIAAQLEKLAKAEKGKLIEGERVVESDT